MYGTGMARGMLVTLKNLVLSRRQFTLHQYPDRKIGVIGLAKMAGVNVVKYAAKNPVKSVKALVGLESVPDRYPQHSRFRGEEFTWYEERCTGCASCAKYCPLGIIEIVTDPNGEAMQDGQKYGIEVFDIDLGRCMFCGLCVEACPYDALHMGSGFEQGQYSRSNLVIPMEQLKSAPKRPSTWFRPQLQDKQYDPRGDEDTGWDQAGRHEKPGLDEQTKRWGQR
jgi:NADH-quinone oxidoreductase subunit I